MPATYEPIASTTLGSTSTSVTLSGIPGTYTDLIVVVSGASNRASINYDGVSVRFNADSASNYSYTRLLGNGSAASSDRSSSQTSGLGVSIVSTGTGTAPSNISFSVMSYANTSVFKTVLASSANPGFRVERTVSLWRSTAAITSLSLTLDQGSFIVGSTFSLYGIKAA